MNYAILGKTGIEVSRLCFGTLTMGPLQSNLSLEEGAAVLRHAIDRGVCFFDTAQLYETYPYLARAMKESGRRDIVIASKTYAYTRALAVAAVEQARQALDRDYIDIFMLHEQESVHTFNGHAPALEYLYECREKGIIRAVGASMHHVAAVYGAVEKGLDIIHPMVNVAGLGIVDGSRADMEQAVTRAHNAGMGVYSMKAFGGGNLFMRAGECLEYVLGLAYVDSVAIGMQSVREVDANVEFFERGAFSQSSEAYLGGKKRRLHIDDWCEGCGKCAAVCGQGAIRIENGEAHCDADKCVLCGYCGAACGCMCIKII